MRRHRLGRVPVTSGPSVTPSARFERLITHVVRDEMVVYDEERDHIHHLNAVATAVWLSTDGQRSLSEIAQAASSTLGTDLDQGAVREALTRLDDAHLLNDTLPPNWRTASTTRRQFLKRSAMAGAALPMVISVSAPQAAQAASSSKPCIPWLGSGCTDHSDCCGNSACDVDFLGNGFCI